MNSGVLVLRETNRKVLDTGRQNNAEVLARLWEAEQDGIMSEIIQVIAAVFAVIGGGWAFIRWVCSRRRQRLSPAAKKLLDEIKASDQSEAKGLSIMHLSGTQAAYLPYLYSQAKHGQIRLIVRDDASQILAATQKLVTAGHLVCIHKKNSLIQYSLQITG
jgi:hypothetical protein